jgi:hypothetical protein
MKKILLIPLFALMACDPADYNPHRWIGNCLMYDMKQPVATKACTSLGVMVLTPKTNTANEVRVLEAGSEVWCGLGERAYSLWAISPTPRTDFDVYASCDFASAMIPIDRWFEKNPDAQLHTANEFTPPIVTHAEAF